MVLGLLHAGALCIATCAPQVPPETAYRAAFDRGVQALEAGDAASSIPSFEAAGERAPLAPLWRTYLGEALQRAGEDRTPDDLAVQWPDTGAWEPVEIGIRGGKTMSLSADGTRLLWGYSQAALIDVDSGRLIARLEPRQPHQRSGSTRWEFDPSGRVVIGSLHAQGANGITGLDVRDARSGRPVDFDGAATINLHRGVAFRWFAAGEDPPECPFPDTVDLESPEGTLRCHVVLGALHLKGIDSVRVSLSASSTFALVKPSTIHGRVRVIDRRSGATLLTTTPGNHCVFAPDESALYVVSPSRVRKHALGGEDDGWTIETQPPTDGLAPPAYMFVGNELARVSPAGSIEVFAAATGQLSAWLTLSPIPGGRVRAARLIAGGTRVLVASPESLWCYAADTGERLWERPAIVDFGIVLDEQGTLIAVRSRSSTAEVLDAETGEPTPGFYPPAVRVAQLCKATEESVIVLLPSGELRRIDIGSGRLLGATERYCAIGGRLFPVDDALVVAYRGGFERIDPLSLVALAGTQHPLPTGNRRRLPVGQLAISPDGSTLAVPAHVGGGTHLVRMTEDFEGASIREWRENWPVAAFSPSGERLALGGDGRLILVDPESGEVLEERALLEGVKLSHAAFHGETTLILGSAVEEFEPPTGWVVDLARDTAPVRLEIPDPFGGGTVKHIHSNPQAGVVLMTVSTNGVLAAFDAETWECLYTILNGGGNWGTLVVRHEGEGPLATVSGMTPFKAGVFDLRSGKFTSVKDVLDLHHAAAGTRLVGVRQGRVISLAAGTLTPELTYEAGADGRGWSTIDGVRRPAPGSKVDPGDDSHLIRHGWSAPIDCFDPWLHDPLALGAPSLRALPDLPVVKGTRLDGDTLSVDVFSGADPIAVIFIDGSGHRRLVRPGKDGIVKVDAGWTLTLEAPKARWRALRVVTVSGVQSRDHMQQERAWRAPSTIGR